MKVTNLSDKQLYLADLKFVPQAQEEGRKGEDRFLAPAGQANDEVLRDKDKKKDKDKG